MSHANRLPPAHASDARPGDDAKVVVLACPVMQALIGPRLGAGQAREIYMDYGLHLRPRRMAPALQAQLDALTQPHTVLLGYGLCGTGLAGLKAGPHTLIIPRTDDCIAVLLGSYDAYARAQREQPGTYYLTRGWIESGDEPLSQYRDYVRRFGRDAADHVIDAMYAHYTVLCLVAATPADLRHCRARIREVADFCAQRWGMRTQERIGSADLIGRLLDAPRNPYGLGGDFVVVPPGGTVETGMFLRH